MPNMLSDAPEGDDIDQTLEDAYEAYGKVETVVDELGQQLEDEHRRLDEGVKQFG